VLSKYVSSIVINVVFILQFGLDKSTQLFPERDNTVLFEVGQNLKSDHRNQRLGIGLGPTLNPSFLFGDDSVRQSF
jgi:hypothetical protein